MESLNVHTYVLVFDKHDKYLQSPKLYVTQDFDIVFLFNALEVWDGVRVTMSLLLIVEDYMERIALSVDL